MLAAVQLNGQNRHQAAALPLVDDKIKPPGVKQVCVAGVILKHLGNGDFLAHGAAAAVQESVVQRVVQVLQKGVLGPGAVWLDAQCPAGGGLLGHVGHAVGAHVLHQLVDIIIHRARVQAVQFLLAGQDDKLVPRTGGRHVDKLLVGFQPGVGLFPGLVGQRQ